MNKSETREALRAAMYVRAGHPDMAARALSALHRAALRAKSKTLIMQAARDLGVDRHPEFIIV